MQLDVSAEYAVLAVCIAISVIVGGLIWRWFDRVWLRLELKRRFHRALDAEAEAPSLLRELGYEVLGAQVSGSYVVELDAQPIYVPLRADYLVARAGCTFVAEVKSGKVAPKLTSASTRRQLLEYLVAFQVDGVLLVDAETRRVHQVVFPRATGATVRAGNGQRLVFLAASLIGALVLCCALWFTAN